jgi:hypothetical protein
MEQEYQQVEGPLEAAQVGKRETITIYMIGNLKPECETDGAKLT